MRIHCVSLHSKDSLSVVVFCYMLMCVGCFSLVVSTCQVIGWKDPLVIPLHGEEITSTKPRCMSLCEIGRAHV